MSYKNKFGSHAGFENWRVHLMLQIKMFKYIFYGFFALQLLAFVMLLLFYYSLHELYSMGMFLASDLLKSWWADSAVIYKTFEGQYVQTTFPAIYSFLKAWMDEQVIFITKLVFKSAWIYALVPLAYYYFIRRTKRQEEIKHIRGAKLLEPRILRKIIGKGWFKKKPYLPFGSVKMPVTAEVKHTFMLGRPGVGKTVAMSQVLEKIKKRKSKTVVYDFKGDYLEKFYDPDKDFIFNPLDARSIQWNIFEEIKTPMDIDAISYSLIPDAKGQGMDPFWNNAARDVFVGILNYLYRTGDHNYKALWEMLTADSEFLAEALRTTPGSEAGAKHIADPASKQTGSILSVMAQYTKVFGYLKDIKGDFSLVKWLESDHQGTIFITNYADIQDTLKPVLTLMIDLMARKLLSMPDDYNRRIFFLLDEFGTLQKMQSIINLLTLSRSKGGAAIIGIQDIGQIDNTYGKDLRQSIVNACGTNVTFSMADPVTAEFASKRIGSRDVIETLDTQSIGVMDNRDGINLGKQRKTLPLLMPSELMGLKDLSAYVKFPNFDGTISKWKYKSYKTINVPFILKEGLSLNDIIMGEEEARKAMEEFYKSMDNSEKEVPEKEEFKKESEENKKYAKDREELETEDFTNVDEFDREVER